MESLSYNSFVLHFARRAEVDEKAKTMAGGFEIVVNLSAVFVRQVGNGLEFDNDFLVADEIRNV